jgi:hypothetical protein
MELYSAQCLIITLWVGLLQSMLFTKSIWTIRGDIKTTLKLECTNQDLATKTGAQEAPKAIRTPAAHSTTQLFSKTTIIRPCVPATFAKKPWLNSTTTSQSKVPTILVKTPYNTAVVTRPFPRVALKNRFRYSTISRFLPDHAIAQLTTRAVWQLKGIHPRTIRK